MYLHQFLYGVYPYIALSVFFLGSLIRFDREQYTWKADSSQLLAREQLRLGSNLFHIGILALLAGHFVGLLDPQFGLVGARRLGPRAPVPGHRRRGAVRGLVHARGSDPVAAAHV
ncbi:hypothetical protein BH20PSE1_BH20PSE1_11580 [soil metagenome]